MPEYLAPGVYVEEVPSGPVPIQGVSTSTAGFVGPTERGPLQPRLVTGWPDYVSWFGGLIDPVDGFLPWAVRGFFDNGGQRLFVARVVRTRDQSQNAVNATTVSRPMPTADANQLLSIQAIGPGTWAHRVFLRITPGIFDPANPPARLPLNVTILYYAQMPPLPLVDPLENANIANPNRREPTATEQYINVNWSPGDPDFLIDYINARSKLVEIDWQAGPNAPNNPMPPAQPLPTARADLQTMQFVGGGGALANLVVANEGTWSFVLDAQNSPTGEVTFTPDQALAGNPAPVRINVNDNNGNPIAILPEGANATTGDIPVSITYTGGGNPVTVRAVAPGSFVQLFDQNPATDGSDLTAADYEGTVAAPPGTRTCLAGLSDIDEISILAAPDQANDVLLGNAPDRTNLQNQVIDQCEILKDRFAVISIQDGQGDVATIRPPRDSSYAAFYTPFIRVFDPRTSGTHLVSPVGHMAGIYARVDVERGVHKAPANEVVRGMVTADINSTRKPLEFTFGKGEQDILNPRNVNVIRDFRADRRGIRIYGARTMSSDPTWRYINVRRLLLYIEESIDEGTQWVVFEPNDEPLWARVRQSVRNFLLLTWRSGALQGQREEEAFFVRCDRTTMTQADIDAGRLICHIGVAPVKPAEYVIFRIQLNTATV